MPSQASHGWTSTCLSTGCRSYLVLSVLESNKALLYPVDHSWRVWRWPAGLCDLWLHTLLPASWSAIIWSRKTTQEIPSEPPLQNSKQGLWNNFDPVGSCVWYIAFNKNHWQERLTCTASTALQSQISRLSMIDDGFYGWATIQFPILCRSSADLIVSCSLADVTEIVLRCLRPLRIEWFQSSLSVIIQIMSHVTLFRLSCV